MNRAPAPQHKKGDPRPKLSNVGMHVVTILDLMYKDTRKLGCIFTMPFELEVGPGVKGYRAELMYTPDSVRPNNSDFSIEELKDREVGKIQRCIAAAGGWEDAARHNVTDEYAARATVYPRPANNPGIKSPLAGEKICIEVQLSNNNKTFPVVFPYTEERAAKALADQKAWEKAEAEKAALKAQGASGKAELQAAFSAPTLPTARTTPALPKAAPTFPPAPWQIHPENDEYVYREDTQEFKTVVELKAELGIQ